MKKINGILLIFFILAGCAATPDERQQTRRNGVDMNLVANTVLATALYNSTNNSTYGDFEIFGRNNTISETHKTGNSISNTIGTAKVETYTQPHTSGGTRKTTIMNSNTTTHTNSAEKSSTKSKSSGSSFRYNPFGF